MHVFGTSEVQKPLSFSLRELLLRDIQGTLLNDEDEYVLSEEGMNFLVHILNQQKTKGLNQAVVLAQDQFVPHVKSLIDAQNDIPFHTQIHSQIIPFTGSRGKPRQRLSIHYPAIHVIFPAQKKPMGFLADHYYGMKSPILPQVMELTNIQWTVLTATEEMAHFQTDRTHCYVFAIEFLRYMNKLSIEQLEAIWAAGKRDSSGLTILRWQDLPVKFMRDYQSVNSIEKYKQDPTSSWQKAPQQVQEKFTERAVRWTVQRQTSNGLKPANTRITKRASVRLATQMESALRVPDGLSTEALITICYSTKPRIQAILMTVAKSSKNDGHPLFAYCFDNLPLVESHLEQSLMLRVFLMSEDALLQELKMLIPMETLFKMTDKQVTQLISQKNHYCRLLRMPQLEQLGLNIVTLMNQTNSKEILLVNLYDNINLLSPLEIHDLLKADKLNDSIMNLLSKKKYCSAAELLEACIYKSPDVVILDVNAEAARYARVVKGAAPKKLSEITNLLIQRTRRPVTPPPSQACEVEAKQKILESSSSDEEAGYEFTSGY